VAVSRDLTGAAVLLGGVGLMAIMAKSTMLRLTALMRHELSSLGDQPLHGTLTTDHLHARLSHVGTEAMALLLPVMAGLTLISVGASLAQTGIVWRTNILSFDLSRINPMAGLMRLLSLRPLAELVKSGLKVALIGAAAFLVATREAAILPQLVQYDLGGILGAVGSMGLRAGTVIGVAVAAVAVVDYSYQRYEWARGLRMTRQEVKEEHKETEGDPLIRSRVRSVQRQMVKKRMMAAVPKADVVVTNPLHLAVALCYDPARMSAPIVVAKGAGHVAEKIKDIARHHGVLIVENKFVARTLYRLVEIGREIPADLYRAVAEILAFVYRTKGLMPTR
jgi:flagellar biosynthetic protein FlhB